MFQKSSRASTFPLAPNSESSPPPSPQEEEALVKPSREEIAPERKLQAAFRVRKMREYLNITPPTSTSVSHLQSPSSGAKFEEQKRDSTIGSVPVLPRLKNDFLWLSLTLILKPTLLPAPINCQICKQGIFSRNPMGAVAWRMHGCGHQFHISCFRSLGFIKPPSFHNDPGPVSSTADLKFNHVTEPCTTNCWVCENLKHQIRIIGRQETIARIKRLEDNLLPWLAPLQHSQYRKASDFYRTVENQEDQDMVVFVEEGLNARYLGSEGLNGGRMEEMREWGGSDVKKRTKITKQ